MSEGLLKEMGNSWILILILFLIIEVELTGTRKYGISISVLQHKNNYTLLNSLRSLLNIDSLVIVNKANDVLKLTKSGDKYFKLFLILLFYKISLTWL